MPSIIPLKPATLSAEPAGTLTSLKVSSPRGMPRKLMRSRGPLRLMPSDSRSTTRATVSAWRPSWSSLASTTVNGAGGGREPWLAAAEDPAVTVAGGYGRDGPDVRPCVRFGDSERSVEFAAEQRLKVTLCDVGFVVTFE